MNRQIVLQIVLIGMFGMFSAGICLCHNHSCKAVENQPVVNESMVIQDAVNNAPFACNVKAFSGEQRKRWESLLTELREGWRGDPTRRRELPTAMLSNIRLTQQQSKRSPNGSRWKGSVVRFSISILR